ncbi:hypothetical protein KL941_000494 [Ogataea angusta]|nr:hypothetical protein KL941_000494 [Ogataea angusta]
MASRNNISTFRLLLEAHGRPADIRPARINEVANWDAIFSDPKMFSSMLIYIAFMMAQLGLSYAGFVYFEVENRPAIYSVSLLYNIFASYFFPILIASTMEENLENPFESLHRAGAAGRLRLRLAAHQENRRHQHDQGVPGGESESDGVWVHDEPREFRHHEKQTYPVPAPHRARERARMGQGQSAGRLLRALHQDAPRHG